MTPVEPPVYRAFARLAFASMLLVGAPLGVWMAGGHASAQAIWLHAAAQLFGFFATLIVGVAHHLLPRFTGRPVRATALTSWLFGLLALALLLRLAGLLWPPLAGVGALLHTAALAAFAVWVWRALDPPPLRLLRAQLTMSTLWLAAAAALEAWLRARGGGFPDARFMPLVYTMALVGGVLGWVLGVLLRAGPMFVREWLVPRWLARATPWALALAVALAALGAVGAPAVAARASDALALGTAAAVVLAAGTLRRSRGAFPMLSRSLPEARIFRVAAASAVAGAGLSVVALGLGAGVPRALTDAIRHLLAIGVLGAVVIAMTFRLIPVLERRPLPWAPLRTVALGALIAAVVLRTAQGWLPPAWREASGVLAAVAFACPAVGLVRRPARARAPDPS